MIPREYQVEAVDSLFGFLGSQAGNPLVALPTATGKSVVIALFCYRAVTYYPRTRIVVLTHVKELIQQNYDKLMQAWPRAPAGIYSAGLKRKDLNSQILFAGIQSVAHAVDAVGWVDVVVIDEAHLVSPDEETRYMQVIAAWTAANPHLRVWGTTATWWRSKHGALTNKGLFTDICFDRTKPDDFQRFIAQGFLSSLVARATETKLDVSGVSISNGDYNSKELEAAIDQTSVTHSALREMIKHGENRRAWIVFCSGIGHAEHVADTLNTWGIRSGVVHSKMGSGNRDQVLRDWYAGTLRCVTNNNVLTTGIDYPDIDFIGMLRPTLSSNLWVQMLGRGMRVAPGKSNCLVLDFAGNTQKLGPVDDPSIPGKPRKGPPGEAPVKICENCLTYNYLSARFCTECFLEFPTHEKLKQQASELPLMSQEIPVIETFKVTSVSYADWLSKQDNRTIRVTYHCGLRAFHEWVSIGGTGFPLHKAKQWWMQRHQMEAPDDIDIALTMCSQLRTPHAIRVYVNTKHPQITAFIWEDHNG